MGGCASKDPAAARAKSRKVIKIKHAGGYVEEFNRPVMTKVVMELHARHWVTKPDIFKAASSHLSVLPPHTLLKPGHTYFLVPFHTLYCRLLRQAISKADLLAFLSQQGLSPAEFHTQLKFKPNPGSTHRLTRVSGKTKRGRGLSHHDHHYLSHHQIRDTFDYDLPLNDDRNGANHQKRASTDTLDDDRHRADHQEKASHDHNWPLNDDRNGANHQKKATIDENLPLSDDRYGVKYQTKASTGPLDDDRHRANHQKKASIDHNWPLNDDGKGANHKKKASIDQNLSHNDHRHVVNDQRKAPFDHNLSLHAHDHGVNHEKSTPGGHDLRPQLVYNHANYHNKGSSIDDKLHNIEPAHLLSDHVINHDLNLTNHISSADRQKRALIDYDIHRSHGAEYQKKASDVRRHPASFHKMEGHHHENAFKANHTDKEFNQKTQHSLQGRHNNSFSPRNQVSTINRKDTSTPVMVKSVRTRKYVITSANKQDFLADVALGSNHQQAGSNNTIAINQGTLKALEECGSLESTKDQGNSTLETSHNSLLRKKDDTLDAVVKTIKPPLEPKGSEALKLQCVPQRAPMRQPPSLRRTIGMQDHKEMHIEDLVGQLIVNAECTQNDMLNLVNGSDHLQKMLSRKQQRERGKSLSSFITQVNSSPEVVIKKPWCLRELMIHSPLVMIKRKGEISDHDSTHVDMYKSSSVATCDQEKTSRLNRMSDQNPHANVHLSKILHQQRTEYLSKLRERPSKGRVRSRPSWEPSLQPVHEYFSA